MNQAKSSAECAEANQLCTIPPFIHTIPNLRRKRRLKANIVLNPICKDVEGLSSSLSTDTEKPKSALSSAIPLLPSDGMFPIELPGRNNNFNNKNINKNRKNNNNDNYVEVEKECMSPSSPEILFDSIC